MISVLGFKCLVLLASSGKSNWCNGNCCFYAIHEFFEWFPLLHYQLYLYVIPLVKKKKTAGLHTANHFSSFHPDWPKTLEKIRLLNSDLGDSPLLNDNFVCNIVYGENSHLHFWTIQSSPSAVRCALLSTVGP